jgi:hypothetical protein
MKEKLPPELRTWWGDNNGLCSAWKDGTICLNVALQQHVNVQRLQPCLWWWKYPLSIAACYSEIVKLKQLPFYNMTIWIYSELDVTKWWFRLELQKWGQIYFSLKYKGDWLGVTILRTNNKVLILLVSSSVTNSFLIWYFTISDFSGISLSMKSLTISNYCIYERESTSTVAHMKRS